MYSKKQLNEIFRILSNSSDLTTRSLEELERLNSEENIFIEFSDDGEIAGFITRERIHNNYFEVKSLFIKNKFRKQGIATKLISRSTEDENEIYISSIFTTHMVKILIDCGYEKANYFQLPFLIMIKFIGKKKVSSLFKALNKKSWLMLKI
ncbi:GNAT family N-acetyltransferase [bacterium]|nr:GNAT family N-acetyltransferase [bacterium]